uniref:Uncharacterized protein n=2 Tax=Ditylenchus dipsaci TaxID=166011 RepID=A0A915E226_9BILA
MDWVDCISKWLHNKSLIILVILSLSNVNLCGFHVSDRNEQPLESEEIIEKMDSITAITPMSSSSHDKNGNFVVNGRINMITSFEVYSALGGELKVELLQDNGLVLCYPTPDQHLFVDSFNESRFQRIKDVCEDMNGIMITTETSSNGKEEQFRIDTRFGNTYRTNIGNENCIVLWLIYDTYKANEIETFKMNSNFGVHALFKSSDTANINSTQKSLTYLPFWKYVAVDDNGKRIQMFWKEIFASPSVQAVTSAIKFKATGGGHCCAITAKIMGARVTKCFYQWVNVGSTCEAPPIEGQSTDNASSDNLSEHERKKLDELYNLYEFSSLSNETAVTCAEDSSKQIAQHFKLKNYNHNKLEFAAKLKAEVKVDALLCLQKFRPSTIKEIRIREMKEETVKSIDQARSFASNTTETYDYLNSFDSTKYETHNVTSIVTNPDKIQTKQLHRFCKGIEILLNTTAEFTNNKDALEKIDEEKKRLGYPDKSVYDTCPFMNTID